MGFYAGPVQWVGPDISGPPRLEAPPATDDERIYARYVQPTRQLSLGWRRWPIGPGVTALLAAAACLAFPGRRPPEN